MGDERHLSYVFFLVLLLNIALIGISNNVSAQLADSPWPMFHYDLNQTRRSSYHFVQHIYAINLEGTQKWRLRVMETTPSAATETDGTTWRGFDYSGHHANVPLSSNVIYIPDDYATIQAAVDAASPGDTIIVRDNTYSENVDVNKDHLTIKSENGAETTIVQAANPDDHVFEISSFREYVNISGLTVKGGNFGFNIGSAFIDYCTISNCIIMNNRCGIYLADASNITLTNNTMMNNEYNFNIGYVDLEKLQSYKIDTSNTVNGKPMYYLVNEKDRIIDSSTNAGYVAAVNSTNITVKDLTLTNNGEGVLFCGVSDSRVENVNVSNNLKGIYLSESSHCVLSNNKASNNNTGIYLWESSDNFLTNNSVFNNSYAGIRLYVACFRNTLTNNIADSNGNFGIRLYNTHHSTIVDNVVNSNNHSGIYIGGEDIGNSAYNEIINNDVKLNQFNGICLDRGWYNTVKKNNISGSHDGILLVDAFYNEITNNTTKSNSETGIKLILFRPGGGSSSNEIVYNTISDNYRGIFLESSPDNNIYLNNFVNNTEFNALSFGGANVWNSPEEITYTYNGKEFTNYLGNYWDNYTGSDADGDGIGDTPYNIDSDVDNYPLVEPFEFYFPCEGDFDSDGDVDGSDLAVFAAGGTEITLEEFAADFGRINCPH